jgi:predicted site-specific integrase-resolvase
MNHGQKEKFVSIGKAALLTGLCPQTLRKYAQDEKIVCYTTPSGTRKFDVGSLHELSSTLVSRKANSDGRYTPKTVERENFIYVRVSSRKQLDDLERQINFVKSKEEFSGFQIIQDIGSGINFKRKGLQTILDSCLQKTIGIVVVAHRDRLCRFGFELVESIICKSGGSLHVIGDEQHKSVEQELSEDLLSIVHIFCCRQMGKRKYGRQKSEINQNSTDPDDKTKGNFGRMD